MKTIEEQFGLKVMTSRFAPPGEIWIITPQEGPTPEAVLEAMVKAANSHAIIKGII